jgi:hypothetical protein
MRRLAVVVTLLLSATTLPFVVEASAATNALSRPCTTFTVKSADTLLGVSHGKKFTEVLATIPTYYCEVSYRLETLTVEVMTTYPNVQKYPGVSKSTTYSASELGKRGEILEGGQAGGPFTYAEYEKRGLYIYDEVSGHLSHKGHAMYVFALAQSKTFTG